MLLPELAGADKRQYYYCVLKNHRQSLGFVFVFWVSVCLLGCANRGNTAAEPVILRIGATIPGGPGSGSGLDVLIDVLTTDALVSTGTDGRQSERLATSWNWDDSHTRLRLKLRSNVLFHDGTQLTPQVVVESLRASMAGADAYSLSGIETVEPSGPDTVDIRLREPDSFLLPNLSVISIRLPKREEVGTGPFRLVARNPSTSLEQFPSYFRGRPKIDRIQLSVYPTQRKAWSAMMRGDIDMLHEVSRDALDFMEAETTVHTYSFPRAYYIPLVFNVRNPVFSNVEVRRAINEAIDKDALVREGLRSRGRPADIPIWPEHWAYNAGQPFSFNPDAARLRLDGAGYKVSQRSPGMPARFSFTCLVYAGDTRFERIALLVQKQLFDIGIDMRLEPVSQRQLRIRASRGDFDAFIIEMLSGKALNWVYAFWHSPTTGPAFIDTGYRAADGALDRIRQARTDDEIRTGTAELSRVLHDDPPAVFLAWQSQARAVSATFEVGPQQNRDILSTVWEWRKAPADLRAAR